MNTCAQLSSFVDNPVVPEVPVFLVSESYRKSLYGRLVVPEHSLVATD